MTEAHTPNSTLAIGGVSSPLDSFVVAESQFSELTFVLKSPPIVLILWPSNIYKAKPSGFRRFYVIMSIAFTIKFPSRHSLALQRLLDFLHKNFSE